MSLLLRVVCLLSVLAVQVYSGPAKSIEGKRLVCYFGSWAVYRYGPAKITSQNIDPSLCTHFIYTFIGLDEISASVKFLDPWMDVGDTWKKGLIPELAEKSRNVNTKYMVALGGWNEGSLRYSRVTCDATRRSKLVKSIVQFCDDNNLDGFDIDWEYPGQRDGGANDKECFTAFVKELYQQLNPKGKILSAAVSANALTLDQSYNIPVIQQYLDFINVMTYDLHGSWDPRTGHHAPLYARPGEPAGEAHLNIQSAMLAWINKGAPPSKLNLGLGTYGRSFNLDNPVNNGIGAPASGIAPCGWIQENGFYAYKEICTNNNTVWTTKWDATQVVPYAYSGRNWVGYDDPASIRAKTCFAKDLNLGGVMFWSIETDDFDGSCGGGTYPLIRAAAKGLADRTCGSDSEETTDAPAPVPDTSAPEAEAPVPETETLVPETETPAPETEAPAPETEAPAPETEGPAPENVTPLPEVPTPVDEPIVEINEEPRCERIGQYIRDPQDCSVFYQCTYSALGALKAIKVQCPPTLGFDNSINTCIRRTFLKC